MANSFCRVIVSKIPETLPAEPLWPPEREEYVASMRAPEAYRERYWAWKVLEKALAREGISLHSLEFTHARSGKWSAEGVCFSLSHTDGWVCAAVSDRAVGVDLERTDRKLYMGMFDRVVSPGERIERTPEALLCVWTQKESIFKCCGEGGFAPNTINCADYPVVSRCLPCGDGELLLSVCTASDAEITLEIQA